MLDHLGHDRRLCRSKGLLASAMLQMSIEDSPKLVPLTT